jgi:hypothetical protein
MPVTPRSAAFLNSPAGMISAKLLDARWQTASGDEDSRAEEAANHPAPVETYESTDGVCNELARIAFNRSAIVQTYHSMFANPRAPETTPRRARPPEPCSSWLHRMLDFLRGRALE